MLLLPLLLLEYTSRTVQAWNLWRNYDAAGAGDWSMGRMNATGMLRLLFTMTIGYSSSSIRFDLLFDLLCNKLRN